MQVNSFSKLQRATTGAERNKIYLNEKNKSAEVDGQFQRIILYIRRLISEAHDCNTCILQLDE